MERKKASEFPQELLNLFDGYVHGGISRRQFLDRAQNYAVGGMTAAALFQMLRPNYAWAIQVPPDDKRIEAESATVGITTGKRRNQRLPRPAGKFGQAAGGARRAPKPRAQSPRRHRLNPPDHGLTRRPMRARNSTRSNWCWRVSRCAASFPGVTVHVVFQLARGNA